MNYDQDGDSLEAEIADSVQSEFVPRRKRADLVRAAMEPNPNKQVVTSRLQGSNTQAAAISPTSDEFRRNAVLVADGIQQLQDSERVLRLELNEANARIEQYQRAEQAMQLKIEAALLDIEVERRRTEKVREAFTALRVRMEGLGRLAADALAELREDET